MDFKEFFILFSTTNESYNEFYLVGHGFTHRLFAIFSIASQFLIDLEEVFHNAEHFAIVELCSLLYIAFSLKALRIIHSNKTKCVTRAWMVRWQNYANIGV